MLETPPDEPIVQIQRVSHESRVHIDIETDDIPAEVARLEKLGAEVVDRLERWGRDAGAYRSTVLHRTATASRLPQERQPLGLKPIVYVPAATHGTTAERRHRRAAKSFSYCSGLKPTCSL